MSTLSSPVKKFIHQYQELYQTYWFKKPKGSVIRVDEVARGTASFYEKIRKIVDWKEEHLMRRIAIERALKRRLFLRVGQDIAEAFILELIRGGHFPNNKIPKSKIQKIQKIIDKYSFILKISGTPPIGKTKAELYTQLLSIAACEVEETLAKFSHRRINALIEFMEVSMRKKVRVGRRALKQLGPNSQEIKNTLIYIAIQQALLSLDEPIITYNLFKRRYSNWEDPSQEILQYVGKNIYSVFDNIEKLFSHPLADKFYKLCEKHDTPYLLLGDIIAQDPMGIEEKILEPEDLAERIKEVYGKRFKTLKTRTCRSAVYSTLSIFLTNVFALYVLEIPFAKYVMGHFNQIAMVADIFVPTFLMFLLVVTIRPPGKKNLKLVQEMVQKISYGEDKDSYVVELYPKRGFITEVFLGFLYTIDVCICLGVMAWLLWYLKFPPFSWLLFYIFVSLIAFAGVKIRERARELRVSEPKATLFNFIVDPLSLPIIYLGRWLSLRWRKINIIGVVFTILIDAPFLIFVEFLEQWRYFLREKQEKIH